MREREAFRTTINSLSSSLQNFCKEDGGRGSGQEKEKSRSHVISE